MVDNIDLQSFATTSGSPYKTDSNKMGSNSAQFPNLHFLYGISKFRIFGLRCKGILCKNAKKNLFIFFYNF